MGDLLTDWRRGNVAFTRAKTKLIIVGSKSTMAGSHIFSMLVDIVDRKKWVRLFRSRCYAWTDCSFD